MKSWSQDHGIEMHLTYKERKSIAAEDLLEP